MNHSDLQNMELSGVSAPKGFHKDQQVIIHLKDYYIIEAASNEYENSQRKEETKRLKMRMKRCWIQKIY